MPKGGRGRQRFGRREGEQHPLLRSLAPTETTPLVGPHGLRMGQADRRSLLPPPPSPRAPKRRSSQQSPCPGWGFWGEMPQGTRGAQHWNPTLSPRLPPSALLCRAEGRHSDHPGPFQPEKCLIADHAIPQAWLTAAVRSTSFRLLRMKQASPLSILQTESSDPMNGTGQQSRAPARTSRGAASPSENSARAGRGAHRHASGLALLGTLLCRSIRTGLATDGQHVPLCSLGSHEVLVLQRRTLEVDHSLRPQRDLQDPPHLDIHLCWAEDHHVVILQERGSRGSVGPARACRSDPRNGALPPERTAPLGLLMLLPVCDTPCPCSRAPQESRKTHQQLPHSVLQNEVKAGASPRPQQSGASCTYRTKQDFKA